MVRRPPIFAAFVGAAALLAFAACGSTSSTTSPGPSPAASAPASTTAPAASPLPPSTTAPPPATPAPVGNLEMGVNGERTAQLQRRLIDLHFDPGPADGQFGYKTAQAVWAFQALIGVPQGSWDGVVTPALFDRIMWAQPAPMLQPQAGGTHTEVDLDRQVLLLFQNGSLRLVTHVSTGRGGRWPTPTGTYQYGRRVAGWDHGPLGDLYNPVYFNGGIAVHGAPSVPSYPASHGCVRIPMHIAEYFPGLVSTGDTVVVFRGGTAAVI